MIGQSRLRFLCMTILPLAIFLVQALPVRADLVQLTRIGDPIWRPVDFHLFSARVGMSGEEFRMTNSSLLPPPHHVIHPQLGIGPGTPHPPPYDTELAEGVRNQGFVDKAVFEVAEIARPNAVFLVWMNVPDPGTRGSSPDFSSGPIIPNTLFPIAVSGDFHRPNLPTGHILGAVPPLNDPSLTPSFDVDGHSHFPFFTALSGPPDERALGDYETVITMTDRQGNGWVISATYQVVPEPGSLILLSIGSLGICVYIWRRRGSQHDPERTTRSGRGTNPCSGDHFR
jgi:hypothetical protein